MFDFIVVWFNHAALNIGAAVACVYYAIIPPQLTGHSESDMRSLRKGNPVKSFIEGVTG